MGGPLHSNHHHTTTPTPNPPPPPPPPPSESHHHLRQSSSKKKNKPKVFRVVRSVFRSFPVKTKRFPFSAGGHSSSNHVTATLFGHRNGGVSLCIQENPYALPVLILDLGIETRVLEKEMGTGVVRLVLECENKETARLVADEPSWTVYCNGKKGGCGVKREATEEDLHVMERLQPMSMGTGALPGKADVATEVDEIRYVRTHFDRVVGSKDSKTLYMVCSDRNNGPELSIFFVRV